MGQVETTTVLVTLRDYITRDMGLQAVCGSCRRKWHVTLTQAVLHFENQFGRTPRQHDLNGWAKCPHCESGRAIRSYVVLNPARQKPVWFSGSFNKEF